MAGAGDFAELLGDGAPLAQNQAGKDGLVKLLVERELSGQKAAVESGQGELEVVGIEAAGFLEGARGGTGAQADVPHALDDGADRFPGLLFGFFVAEREQHVDVGKGEQIFAAISAQGDQGNVRAGLSGEGPAPHFNEDAVDDRGASADGGGAVAGAFVGLADKRHLPQILLP